MSFRFSFKRRISEGHDGKGVFKCYQLPYFEIRSEKLQLFLKGFTQTDVEAPKATEEEIEIVEGAKGVKSVKSVKGVKCVKGVK